MSDLSGLPLTSSHWGTYRARVSNGRVQDLIPFEEDPDPSPIGQGILDVQHGPTRVDAPMVRQSWLEHGPGANPERRGQDPFVAVSWDEAAKLVAKELERVRTNHGNQSIFAGSYGWASAGRFHHAQGHLKRFLNCIGGFTASKNAYSFASAEVAVPHILGSFREFLDSCTAWEVVRDHTQLMVCFGGIPLKNGQICQGGTGAHVQRRGVTQAAQAGIHFVNVSPLKADMLDAAGGDWHPIIPNTDVAMMLALMWVLETEGLTDHSFLDRYTTGFARFRPYLMGDTDGQPKTPDWAAPICGIEAQVIRDLARRMAAQRTMISISWSLTRQDHGEQQYWAAITLAAMLGQIGLPGGGIGFGFSATNYVGGHFRLIPGAAFPQGQNPVDEFIPVARISDMLLHPGAEYDYDGQRRTYPDIKLVWWAGGNPFHHHQDLGRMVRAWQQPDTIICNEWCWNSQAKFADIVLPCTTPLERADIALSPRDPYIVYMSQLTEPYGAARNDYDIFRAIAAEMGVDAAFSEGRSAEDWRRWIWDQSVQASAAQGIDLPDLETLQTKGWHKVPPPEIPQVMLQAFRDDPQAHPLATPSGRIEIFSDVVAGFDYEDCPGHAVWRAPKEWLGHADAATYPIHLLSNQPKTKLHSQVDHGSVSRAARIQGREPINMHPGDAAARGLKPGDIVRVHNRLGACLAGVALDAGLRRGVAHMSTGAWYDPAQPGNPDSLCKHGNPNVLTRDEGTSRLAQGPTAHSCLVEVTAFDGPLPEVTAHTPPVILRDRDPDAM